MHTWGSLQSEFLYGEKVLRKLAIAHAFWHGEKGNQTENKLERRPCPGYFNGVGYDQHPHTHTIRQPHAQRVSSCDAESQLIPCTVYDTQIRSGTLIHGWYACSWNDCGYAFVLISVIALWPPYWCSCGWLSYLNKWFVAWTLSCRYTKCDKKIKNYILLCKVATYEVQTLCQVSNWLCKENKA